MDRVEDEPVRFYFEHRDLIEQWAALSKPAREIVRGVLGDIAEQISDEAPSDATVLSGDDGGYTMVAYWRQAWAGDDGRPKLAIGLGWSPSRVSVHVGNGERPWVGIWRGQTTKDDPFIAAVHQATSDARHGQSFVTTWSWWPLYRYLASPTGAFWDNLRPWNQAVIDCVHETWDRFADSVDSAVLAVGGGRRDEGPAATTEHSSAPSK